MEKHDIEIELSQNIKSFTPEIFFKVLLCLITVYIVEDVHLINFDIALTEINKEVFIPLLIIILNLSLTLITIFSMIRRRKSIYAFYKTKIISHSEYGISNLSFHSDF